ncbi:hypothetical protein GQ42DRAFT_163511 [Ramicandelaber brevisporus]|nr:hypothetical protein GQ42DRAFT_163511 [Ramicandelaber brevisporus]
MNEYSPLPSSGSRGNSNSNSGAAVESDEQDLSLVSTRSSRRNQQRQQRQQQQQQQLRHQSSQAQQTMTDPLSASLISSASTVVDSNNDLTSEGIPLEHLSLSMDNVDPAYPNRSNANEDEDEDEEDTADDMNTLVGHASHRKFEHPSSSRDGNNKGPSRIVAIAVCVIVTLLVLGFGAFVINGGKLPGMHHRKGADGDRESTSDTSAPSDGPVNGKERFTYKEMNDYAFYVRKNTLSWIAHPNTTDTSAHSKDGYYVQDDKLGTISIRNIATNETTVIVRPSDMIKPDGGVLEYFEALVSPDWKYVLFGTNRRKEWRHSFFAEYYVFDVNSRKLKPLIKPSHGSVVASDKVQLVKWSPIGHRVAYVVSNNIYITDLERTVRVTSDGSDAIFNGIADWVYEEEVLSTPDALWWSPDAESLLFMRLDDSKVNMYSVPMYRPEESDRAYPDTMNIRYPKPGFANPLAEVHLYNVDFSPLKNVLEDLLLGHTRKIEFAGGFPVNDMIVTGTWWLTDKHDSVMVRLMNRVQDYSKHYLISTLNNGELSVKLVREWNTNAAGGDNGWIEGTNSVRFVPANEATGLKEPGYIDILPNKEGYYHLVLFSPITSSKPTRVLTDGYYEVVDGSATVDARRGKVYFLSTHQSSLTKNLYTIDLRASSNSDKDGGDGDDDNDDTHHDNSKSKRDAFRPTNGTSMSPPLVASKNPVIANISSGEAAKGTYSVRFSSHHRYYQLTYEGPSVPWQRVLDTQDRHFDLVTTDGAQTRTALSRKAVPKRKYLTIESEPGVYINAMVIYPPDFDESKSHEYGALFSVYGGPNSQRVNRQYGFDWHDAFVSQTDDDQRFIVVMVDGRGTAYKGRKFRMAVRTNLGKYEATDQINAAKYIKSLPYINPHKIAIWGWSYGGFLSTKVLEMDAGQNFAAGVAVAPVTRWRLYDSIYTERYMKTPDQNPIGYLQTSITKMDSFKKLWYLVMHGSGDDNVHLQNTLDLVSDLTASKVRTFDMRVFTDSDHSIYERGANPELYAYMTKFLLQHLGADSEPLNATSSTSNS